MAMNRSKLQTAVLLLALFTHSIQATPVNTAIQDMKNKTQEVLNFLEKKAQHALDEHNGTHTIGCISEPKDQVLDQDLISTFAAYFSEAIDLDIQANLTEGLQGIKQYIQDYQDYHKWTAAAKTICRKAFREDDDDYTNLSKVRSLLVLFRKWLERL